MMAVDAWEIVLGFMDAQTVFAADELGIFAALHEKPGCPDEIADAVGIPADSARRLLGALAAIGLAERLPDGAFRNTLEAENKLVPGTPGYIGAMFHHLRNDLYPLWAHVVDALREGRHQWHRAFDQETIPTEEMYSDQEALRAFMEGMHCITHEAAVEFARKARSYLCEIDSIIDVGGASGAFLIALAEQYDHIEGTVFDLPQVEPIARGFFEAHVPSSSGLLGRAGPRRSGRKHLRHIDRQKRPHNLLRGRSFADAFRRTTVGGAVVETPPGFASSSNTPRQVTPRWQPNC